VIGVNRVGTDGNGHPYSGDSMIVDALGNILFQKTDEEIIHTLTLEKEPLLKIREELPFWKDGDDFHL